MKTVYEVLRKHSKNGIAVMSIRELAKHTESTETNIRTELKKLVQDGYITPQKKKRKDGGDDKTEYIMTGKRPPEELDKRAMEVKSIYCKYVAERKGSVVSPTYSFGGYAKIFKRIADFCKEEDINIHLYILACFHTFSSNWCREKFRQPFPPPYILASKKHARERYDNFIRFVQQRTFEPAEAKDYIQQLKDTEYILERVGAKDNVNVIAMLVNNETIVPEYFLARFPDKEKLIRAPLVAAANRLLIEDLQQLLNH